MANTPVEIVYKALKDKYEPGTYQVRYPYVSDGASAPYIYMYEVDDPRIKGALCDARGGESRITIGLIAKTFESCVDGLESILAFAESIYGSYAPIEAWGLKALDVRDLTGLEQSEDKVYRREFDLIIQWAEKA